MGTVQPINRLYRASVKNFLMQPPQTGAAVFCSVSVYEDPSNLDLWSKVVINIINAQILKLLRKNRLDFLLVLNVLQALSEPV